MTNSLVIFIITHPGHDARSAIATTPPLEGIFHAKDSLPVAERSSKTSACDPLPGGVSAAADGAGQIISVNGPYQKKCLTLPWAPINPINSRPGLTFYLPDHIL
jgi:hypothetical protein